MILTTMVKLATRASADGRKLPRRAVVVLGNVKKQFRTMPLEVTHDKGPTIYDLACVPDLGEMNSSPKARSHLHQLMQCKYKIF